MKRIFIILFALVSQHSIAQANNSFFNITASGAPAEVSITLCLDGKGPLSCQNYTVSALTLSIRTNVSNHLYPNAGIKVNTPGYSPTGCTDYSNGYCLFSVSDTNAAIIALTHSRISIFTGTQSGNIRVSHDSGTTWSSTTQPGGSMGEGLYVLNSDTLFIGGFNGHVEVSKDGGNTWASTGALLDGTPVNTVYAVDDQTLYAGTAGAGVSTSGYLYHSTNGGQTWTQLPALPNSPSPLINVYILGSTLYATNGAGLYSSPLSSISWTAVTMPGGTTSVQTVSILDADHFFAGVNANSHIDITSNEGTSWTTSSTYPGPGGSTSAIFAVDANTIYSATENDGLFYSLDGASSWTGLIPPDGSYINSLFFKGSNLYAATVGGNLGISGDNGSTWTLTTQPGGNVNFGLYMTPEGQMYVGGSNGSVMTSTDNGASWTPLPAYPDFQQIFGVTKAENTLYVASEDFGVLYSTNNGNSWTNAPALFAVPASSVAVYGGVIYTSLQNNPHSIQYSTDGGNTFTPTASQPDPSSWVTSLFFEGATLYAGTESGKVAYSTNQGNSWTLLPSFTDDNSAVNAVYALNGVVYAGTQDGHVEAYSAGASAWYPTTTMPDGSPVLSLSVR
ncbi:MAG: YCF48-related protein [Gammaproteobacteria bacterium]